jgi:anti-sigma B factor antagonist
VTEPIAIDVSSNQNGGMNVAVRGELDLAEAPRLEEVLRELAGHDVVVDLSGLSFIDSSGIGALVRAHAAAKERDCTLQTTGEHGIVRRALEVVGLFDVLHGGATAP